MLRTARSSRAGAVPELAAGVRLRRLPLQPGTLIAGGGVVFLAAADGGYFSYIWPFATVAFAAAGVLAAVLFGVRRLPRAAIGVVIGWTVLLAWTALTAFWSSNAGLSLSEASRTLLYVTAIGAFLVAPKGLVPGLIGGATIVSLWALIDRWMSPRTVDPFEGKLLVGPLGYANALGALAAMGAVGAILIAARSRGPARLAACACLVPLVLALSLTGSRGAWLAAAAGAAIGLLANARRPAMTRVAVAIALASLAIVLIVPISATGNRAAYWKVARSIAPAHLIAGQGAGTFGASYIQHLPQGPPGHDAHSLYLQTLDELGVVGLAILIAVLAIPLITALVEPERSAVPLAVYAVFLLHAGVDWDWEMPAVTIAGLAAGVAIILGARLASNEVGRQADVRVANR